MHKFRTAGAGVECSKMPAATDASNNLTTSAHDSSYERHNNKIAGLVDVYGSDKPVRKD